MNTVEEIVERLKQHSGIESTGTQVSRDTFAELLFSLGRGDSQLDSADITQDILSCLDLLNRKLRQKDEATIWDKISRPLTYAVSGILQRGLETALQCQNRRPQSSVALELLRSTWRIGCAWDALLAGDIDDIIQHVSLEALARSLA